MNDTFERFTIHSVVGSGMVGEYGTLMPAAYLQTAVSIAEQYLAYTHMDVPLLIRNYGISWVLLSASFEIQKPVLPGQSLQLTTWSSGYQKPVFRRELEICSDDGTCLVTGAFFSGLLNMKTRHMVLEQDLPDLFRQLQHGPVLFTAGSRIVWEQNGFEEINRRVVHPSWIDALGHANNVRYGDIIYDAMTGEQQRQLGLLSRFEIQFLRELRKDEYVRILRKEEGSRVSFLGIRESDDIPAFVSHLSFT